MKKDYQTVQIARFIERTEYDMLDKATVAQLKRHLLDSFGSLIYAMDRPTIHKLYKQISQTGEGGKCKAPGVTSIAVDRAAQLFTALIRYPDFMDNFLGKEATCHPSDNIGPLLAAGQLGDASGKDFLVSMAIGYEVECRMVEEIPVMIKGFDHTVLLAYSATAAIAKMLSLTQEQASHALGMAGCSFNPLVTCRASYTYEWKGLASSLVNMGCMNLALLAKEDVTGPISLFEGPKGFNDVYGMELDYDWRKEDFSLIQKCILKSFNSEVHTQSAIEAALELKWMHGFTTMEIEKIDVTTFLTAYHIVGGGAYGDRKEVFSKEQADHSLPYVIAVALLDGTVYPEQLLPGRIVGPDVQELLQKVNVNTSSPIHKPMLLAGLLDPYTQSYPEKVHAKVGIVFKDGKKIQTEKKDYHGFFTRPLSWEDVEEKFRVLAKKISVEKQDRIIEIISDMENRKLSDLIEVICEL